MKFEAHVRFNKQKINNKINQIRKYDPKIIISRQREYCCDATCKIENH